MPEAKSVLGIYSRGTALERAISELEDAGFFLSDISVLLPECPNPEEMPAEQNSDAHPRIMPRANAAKSIRIDRLASLGDLGTVAIPGLGRFIAAGPIVVALGGVGDSDSVGDFTDALISMGIPKPVAKFCERQLENGAMYLSVLCDTPEEIQRAKVILMRTGAEEAAQVDETFVGGETPNQTSAKGAGASY
jgi:hypothetical protein